MEELGFDRMLYSIAVGLYEKEQCTDKYPYSSYLSYGINMFAALALKNGQKDVLSGLHEAAFITDYAAKPVKEWFAGWKKEFTEKISKYQLFQTGALVILGENQTFYITDECADLNDNTENDMFNALTQKHIYQMMKMLDPDQYTSVRKFIVEHPICSEKEIRKYKMKCGNPDIWNIIKEAYEDIPSDSYRCPKCGWTMRLYGVQTYCCNRSCTEEHPDIEHLEKLDVTDNMPLKHGVMRYMCLPGKLELDIKARAEKYGCKTALWPERDRYDIKIIFKNEEIWAVDAKTHLNPYALAESVRSDRAFASVPAAKRFFVIPEKRKQERKDYCDICNAVLPTETVRCITDRELFRMIKKEAENVNS